MTLGWFIGRNGEQDSRSRSDSDASDGNRTATAQKATPDDLPVARRFSPLRVWRVVSRAPWHWDRHRRVAGFRTGIASPRYVKHSWRNDAAVTGFRAANRAGAGLRGQP